MEDSRGKEKLRLKALCFRRTFCQLVNKLDVTLKSVTGFSEARNKKGGLDVVFEGIELGGRCNVINQFLSPPRGSQKILCVVSSGGRDFAHEHRFLSDGGGSGGVDHPTTWRSTVRQKRPQNADAPSPMSENIQSAATATMASGPPTGPAGMSLSLPVDGGAGGVRDSSASTSPRRAVSPLLEVRRPHCTLNCDHCNAILEDRFKHLSKNLKTFPKTEKVHPTLNLLEKLV